MTKVRNSFGADRVGGARRAGRSGRRREIPHHTDTNTCRDCLGTREPRCNPGIRTKKSFAGDISY